MAADAAAEAESDDGGLSESEAGDDEWDCQGDESEGDESEGKEEGEEESECEEEQLPAARKPAAPARAPARAPLAPVTAAPAPAVTPPPAAEPPAPEPPAPELPSEKELLLKRDLKVFEVQFRAAHGRRPRSEDVFVAGGAIWPKYKEYYRLREARTLARAS